ncbi:MAG: hypothetical protein P1P90_03275 [Patescibacteria group bacterium]|nr:hypothetical protein [Patescibacteria group bacterium]
MNLLDRITWHWYGDILPWLRVRGKFYYWCLRYGGKKRIPKEVIARAMEKSIERMNRNLKLAQDSIPLEDMSEEERLALRDMRMQAGELGSELKNLHHE